MRQIAMDICSGMVLSGFVVIMSIWMMVVGG